ncbi:survival protein sure-domain-containing protein [Parasitella parasitica]|nr:survival protein sure-domain-containing protein [Parasitella parasitica]
MKVLISNDDGPPSLDESPFILPFIEHLESLGWDVKVCLPDCQKSWIAKSFMIKEDIRLRYFNRETKQITEEKQNDNDFYLLSGTPATCVNINLHTCIRNNRCSHVSAPHITVQASNINIFLQYIGKLF